MSSHLRAVKTSRMRHSKVAGARDTIAGFSHDIDIIGLTHGQFSLLDLLHATLDITGDADVDIATWSAGIYDVDAARRFAAEGRIRRIRFIMDSATQKRGQASAVDIGDLFGHESIRTTRTHAKFALISNQQWAVTITTSMNLNLNPRCEQFEMTEDRQRHDFFAGWVDSIFAEIPAGGQRRADDRQLPASLDLETVTPKHDIAVAPTIKTGVWE